MYVPEIIPPPASLLRQVAYGQAVKIPGPMADPLGWHDLSPAVIFGNLSNGKASKLQCTVGFHDSEPSGVTLMIFYSFLLRTR